MSAILEQLRTASPDEQQQYLACLVKALYEQGSKRPLAIKDEATTIAYLSPSLAGERIYPEITPEVISIVEERMRNPGPTMTSDEFLRRLDKLIEERTAAASTVAVGQKSHP